MTFEELCNEVRIYVEEKPFDGPGRTGGPSWLDRLDECLAEIRTELSLAAQDDDRWSFYLDMTDRKKQ